MSTLAQIFEKLTIPAFVVPAGAGTIRVAMPSLYKVGWQLKMQATTGGFAILNITGIDATASTLSVTRASIDGSAAAGATLSTNLTITPIAHPLFNEPGAVPVTFQAYQRNRLPVVVPTGSNSVYLVYPKADYMNPVWIHEGLRIFVQGIGTFEVSSSGLVEGVETIDATPYTPVYKVPVKVVRLLPGVTAGTTNIPDGAAFFCYSNQLDVVENAAVHTGAFFDMVLGNAGPFAPGTDLPITAVSANTDPGEVFGKVNGGSWQCKKAGIYAIEAFLNFNLFGYTPSDIKTPQACVRVGGTPVAFGPFGSPVNSERLGLAVTTTANLAVDNLVTVTWLDQSGTGVPQNLETSGGSAGVVSYLKVTFIRE